MNQQPKAYSYLRFSTPEQALGDSKRRQVDAARAWAAQHGLTLDEELTDEGVSGFRGANTKADSGLGGFLRAIQAGMVPEGSFLIVESLDRLTRDRVVHAQMLFLQILAAGVTIVTLMDGRTYSTDSVNANPMDMIASILVMMRANEESETKSRRLRAAWAAKRKQAAEGKRLTTVTPAWLEATPDGGFGVIAERAAIVRRIFDETLDGLGQHKIAERLTQEGVAPWRQGRVWHRTYVRKVLENEAVVGTAVLHETVRLDGGGRRRKPVDRVPNYFPTVVDLETWTRTRAILGGRSRAGMAGRGRHAGAPVRHLLANLARCPACDGTMTRVSKGPGGGRAYLVCTRAKAGGGCVYRGVPVQEVDAAIFGNVGALLGEVPAANEREEALLRELGALEVRRSAAVDELEDLKELRRSRQNTARTTGREAELYTELAATDEEELRLRSLLVAAASPLVDARVDRLWTALETGPQEDLTSANGSMREAFEAVVVDYERGSLEFRWRHGGQSHLYYASPFSDESATVEAAFLGGEQRPRKRAR